MKFPIEVGFLIKGLSHFILKILVNAQKSRKLAHGHVIEFDSEWGKIKMISHFVMSNLHMGADLFHLNRIL